jgi:hypothetical protein
LVKGVTRTQIVNHFTQDWNPETWELVKKGILSHWYYKIGDEPGIIALINCDSMEKARTLANNTPAVKEGFIEFNIDPVNHFQYFD